MDAIRAKLREALQAADLGLEQELDEELAEYAGHKELDLKQANECADSFRAICKRLRKQLRKKEETEKQQKATIAELKRSYAALKSEQENGRKLNKDKDQLAENDKKELSEEDEPQAKKKKAACETSHTEAGQGDGERSEPSSEPGSESAPLKPGDGMTHPSVQLNNDCLAKVMDYLYPATRMRLQRVSKQWLDIGQQFRHLEAGSLFSFHNSEVYHRVLRDLGVSLPVEEEEEDDDDFLRQFHFPLLFHWVAFARVLACSQGSVRSLDLEGLSSEQLITLVPFLNPTLCPAVKHVKLDVEEGGYDQAVAAICHRARLPSLSSLSLECPENLTSKSLCSLTTHCLPHLTALDMTFMSPVLEDTLEDLKSFFRALPTKLERFAIDGRMVPPSFLQLFVERLQAKPGLPELASLTLLKHGVAVDQHESELLDSMCSSPVPKLKSLKLAYGRSRGAGFLLPLQRLTGLTRFQLDVAYNEQVPLPDVARVLRAMSLLQILHLRVGAGECEELIASLCGLKDLHDLTIVWVCVGNQLARLGTSLPQLRRLKLLPWHASDPSREQLAGLASLVSHCTRLEYLHLSVCEWELDEVMALLRELESALSTSRAASPCPHLPPLQQGACDMCPALAPLRVVLLSKYREQLNPIFESFFLRLVYF